MSTPTSVVVEADGAARGNPGPAAYGAVLRDADTGQILAEDGDTLGKATNNVAEYSGLVAGLRLAAEFAPGARVEVRMDSQLVVEQMSGRWKTRHERLRELAMEARQLAPEGTTYTWVPRAANSRADKLANQALDGLRTGVVTPDERPWADDDTDSVIEEVQDPDSGIREGGQRRGWSHSEEPPTTLVLVRHGVTAHTVDKRFSGGLASANPGLSDEGRAQVRATGEWLEPIADRVDAVVSSPVRRTLESAEIIAGMLGKQVDVEPGFAEMEFGTWDGLTFAEVAERFPDELEGWLGAMDVAPGGGESFRQVQDRVLAALESVLEAHTGKTVVVVSHVTPIKTLVAHAVAAPLESVYRMELTPASVTVLSFFKGGKLLDEPMASMRLYNARPGGEGFLERSVH